MKLYRFVIDCLLVFMVQSLLAQNPIVRDQFSADPSARVFEGKVYLYPSHDILAQEGKGRPGWFCMEDYHVFSSQNLTDWTDHGVIVSQEKVPWVNSAFYSMWASDCIEQDGKFYFYFPAVANDTTYGRGFSIGVAVSDKPYGPFTPEPKPIQGVHGIDPNPFTDQDGQAYLYWSMRKIYAAKLKENMLELASEPKVMEGLPEEGLKEGPYLFERNGIYYMTYPHVQNKIERLEYAMGDNPLGPFKVAGVLMDESPTGCWTNHQSIIQHNDQWYLFYHQNDLSPKFDKNRSVRIDSLFFYADGTIKKVTPTLRGVGLTDARQKIEIDRYSLKSDSGASIAFLDTLNTFNGWKTIFDVKDAWIQYNGVDFGGKPLNAIMVTASSKTGGVLQVRLDEPLCPIIAQVVISKGEAWQTIQASMNGLKTGIRNLVVSVMDDQPVEVDWISFQ